MATTIILSSFLLFFSITTHAAGIGDMDVLKFVNPFIGTHNGGNVFSGATRPHSFAKAVADVNNYNNQGGNQAGFTLDGAPIIGFSMAHDSGTGSRPSLGNFPLFPELCPADNIDNCVFGRNDRMISYDWHKLEASPGYFAIELDNHIRSRMTVGERSALFEFTFPHASPKDPSPYSNASRWQPWPDDRDIIAPLILLDLNDLQGSRLDANITVNAQTGRMVGNGTFLPSFGAGSYVMHFCADLVSNTAIRDNGVFINHRAAPLPKQLSIPRGYQSPAGGWIRFEPDKNSNNETIIMVRMGLSYISAEQACRNIHADQDGLNTTHHASQFDALKAQAEDVWRDQFSVITINDTSVTSNPMLFYSAYTGR